MKEGNFERNTKSVDRDEVLQPTASNLQKSFFLCNQRPLSRILCLLYLLLDKNACYHVPLKVLNGGEIKMKE